MPGHQLAADYTWWFHLFAFVGSVLLVGQRALQLVTGRQSKQGLERLSTLLATIIVAVLVVDGLYLVDMSENLALNAVFRVGVVTVVVFLLWFQARLAFSQQLIENRWRRLSSLTLLMASLAIAGWSSHRYYTTVAPIFEETPVAELPGQHVKSRRYVAVTDRGREVPLFRWKAESEKDPKTIQSMMALLIGRLPSVIQRDEPDQRSNCHGWVFTRGRFLLTGNNVAQILEDNQYEIVTSPKEGDVVIYRNADGGIVHTGLVVGILVDNSVIVESKWSVGSRFLHGPEGQPYSTRFAYYRTTRPSHSLAIRFQNRSDIADGVRPKPSAIKQSTQRPASVTVKRVLTADG